MVRAQALRLGAGLPIAWQGWAVLALFSWSMVIGRPAVRPGRPAGACDRRPRGPRLAVIVTRAPRAAAGAGAGAVTSEQLQLLWRSSARAPPTVSHSSDRPRRHQSPGERRRWHPMSPMRLAPQHAERHRIGQRDRDQQQLRSKHRRSRQRRRVGGEHRRAARDHQHQPGNARSGSAPRDSGAAGIAPKRPGQPQGRGCRSRRPASPARADGRHWRAGKRSPIRWPIGRSSDAPTASAKRAIAAFTRLSAARPSCRRR